MNRRFIFSTLALALGLGLAAAAFAGSAKNGGMLRVVSQDTFDSVDPSRAYFTQTWVAEFATACKLYNFGERGQTLHPEAATSLPKVSNNGRTYTFTVRTRKQAPRFASGQVVTAANFAWALNRSLRLRPYSPAANFLSDPSATNIVGAKAVLADRATSAAGIRVRRNRLVVTLTKPSPAFVTQLTMPFFQAMPLNWGTETLTETDLPKAGNTCGPYHLTASDHNSFALAVRNPFYRGSRPHHVAAIRWTFGVTPESQELLVEKNQQDLTTYPPPSATRDLQRRFGRSGRFKLYASSTTCYFALNTQSSLFKANARLRRAVNFAIDRRALVAQLGGLATPTDQILPPAGMPGFRNWRIYPFSPNLQKAKALANGHLRGRQLVLYAFSNDPGPAWGQIVQADLKRLGLSVTIKLFDPGTLGALVSRRGEPFDMATGCIGPDYPDPYDFISVLFATPIRETGNTNGSYFDVPSWNRRMDRAAALPVGPRRYAAYAKLDRDIVRGPAPVAAFANAALPAFRSDRFARFVYSIYGPNLAASELK